MKQRVVEACGAAGAARPAHLRPARRRTLHARLMHASRRPQALSPKSTRSPQPAPPALDAVLPKAGLVVSEKGGLAEVLCKPKILPLKSITLQKLEEMEVRTVAPLHTVFTQLYDGPCCRLLQYMHLAVTTSSMHRARMHADIQPPTRDQARATALARQSRPLTGAPPPGF